MQIIRSENTAPANQAVYTVPAGQPEAIFSTGGARYRIVRVMIFAEGYDGGVLGQDMSRKAWVFAIRQTKRGTDYASGIGLHEGVDDRLNILRDDTDGSWGRAMTALVDALMDDGWDVRVEDGEQDYRFAPKAPETAREVVKRDPRVTHIDRPLADKSPRIVEAGKALVGVLTGDQLWTGLTGPGYEDHGAMEVPERYVADYIGRLLDWDARGWLIGTPHDRSNALLMVMMDAGDEIFQADPDLVYEIPRRIRKRSAGAADSPSRIANQVAQALREAISPAPSAVRLETTADVVQEGDWVMEIAGVPMNPQLTTAESGLLAEHRARRTEFPDTVTITVWVGSQMVGLLLDADTKVAVRRPIPGVLTDDNQTIGRSRSDW